MSAIYILLTGAVMPFLISLISNYIIWEVPYKRWIPKLVSDNFNSHIIEKGGDEKFTISIDLKNQSKHDAYRIDVYYNFLDKSGTLLYTRQESRAFLKRDGGKERIVTPLNYKALLDAKIIHVDINIVYQNRFGAIFQTHKEEDIQLQN